MEKVALVTGYVVWAIFGIIFGIIFLKIISRAFLRPWYFIKHLIPGFRLTEKGYTERKNRLEKAWENLSAIGNSRFLNMELKRKGNIAILTVNKKNYWFQPKHYLAYIKKEK